MAFVDAGMLVVGSLTPVARPQNWRPRVSATTGTAPAKLAWLVLSTLATTVSGLSYQIVQSGTCESAGGVDISSNLAECIGEGAVSENEGSTIGEGKVPGETVGS